MSDSGSITEWVRRLKSDPDPAAAEREIWGRCVERMLQTAGKYLRGRPRRFEDEEDLVAGAFEAFFRGAREGRFHRLENGYDLWQILTMLVERRAIGVLRRETSAKRGGGRVRGESVFEGVDPLGPPGPGIEAIPDPAYGEGLVEEVRELLDGLDDETLRSIATMRLAGHSNPEIAASLNIALRSVERKLGLIRRHLRLRLDEAEP